METPHDMPNPEPRAYCHSAEPPLLPQSVPGRAVSRRSLLRGAAAIAGGLGVAATGAGALGNLPNFMPGGTRSAQALTGKALVVYDGEGPYGWIGSVHASLLTNLLGRFTPQGASSNSTVRVSTSQYRAGDIERYDATFYLGTVYDNPLPAAFKDDVMKTAKPVVWFKYNIHQLAWANAKAFEDRFGLKYYGNTALKSYTKVEYKGTQLNRNTIDPEVSWMDIADPQKARIVALLKDPAGGANGPWPIPYVTRGANLWYVGDIPFSYISEEDRYLVIADLLFEMMGVSYTQTKRALVRIEDVDASADPADLRNVADYLSSVGVPFSVALIPFYRDPLGTYNGGKPMSVNLSAAKDVVAALKYMQSKGGQMVMHGVTHQSGSRINPYTGVSGDDYEFFRVTENADHSLNYVGPVENDSSSWCSGLLSNGLNEFKKAGFTPIGFEAPHYAASGTDYKVFASRFDMTYHRALYFDSRPVTTAPSSTTSTSTRSKTTAKSTGAKTAAVSTATATPAPVNFGGQFFPYVVQRDVYGQKVLPENLGNIEPFAWPDPVVGPYPQRFPADLIRAASKNLVVRDAWASFFFHPFWDIKYLQDSVNGILGMGYKFQKASSIGV